MIRAHWAVIKLMAYVTWLHLGGEHGREVFEAKVQPKLDEWSKVPGYGDAFDWWVETRIFSWWTLKVHRVVL